MSHCNLIPDFFYLSDSSDITIEGSLKIYPDDFIVEEVWDDVLELEQKDTTRNNNSSSSSSSNRENVPLISDELFKQIAPWEGHQDTEIINNYKNHCKYIINEAFANNKSDILLLDDIQEKWLKLFKENDSSYSSVSLEFTLMKKNIYTWKDIKRACDLNWPHLFFINTNNSDNNDLNDMNTYKVKIIPSRKLIELLDVGLSHEDIKILQIYLAQGPLNDDSAIIGNGLTREQRTELYSNFRQKAAKGGTFQSWNCKTVSSNNGQAIEISWRSKSIMNGRKQYFNNNTRNGGNSGYIWLWFTLQRRNIEHFHALSVIASCAGVNVDQVSTAGIKDKCSISCLKVSVRLPVKNASGSNACRRKRTNDDNSSKDKGNEREILLNIATQLFCRFNGKSDDDGKYMLINNLEWKSESINAGQHSGNRFTIRIRDIGNENDLVNAYDVLQKRLEIAYNQGFPNYFGSQRFGNLNNNDNDISKDSNFINRQSNNVTAGRHLSNGNYKQAVLSLITNSSSSNSSIDSTKNNAESKLITICDNLKNDATSYSQMISSLPSNSRMARQLLVAMRSHTPATNGNAFGGLDCWKAAILSLSKSIKDLQYNSFASWCWNKIISKLLNQKSNGKNQMILPKEIMTIGRNFLCDDPLIMKAINTVIQEEGVGQHYYIQNDDNYNQIDMSQVPPAKKRPLLAEFLKQESCKPKVTRDNDTIVLRFGLPVGTYATTLLRELLRNNNML